MENVPPLGAATFLSFAKRVLRVLKTSTTLILIRVGIVYSWRESHVFWMEGMLQGAVKREKKTTCTVDFI